MYFILYRQKLLLSWFLKYSILILDIIQYSVFYIVLLWALAMDSSSTWIHFKYFGLYNMSILVKILLVVTEYQLELT